MHAPTLFRDRTRPVDRLILDSIGGLIGRTRRNRTSNADASA